MMKKKDNKSLLSRNRVRSILNSRVSELLKSKKHFIGVLELKNNIAYVFVEKTFIKKSIVIPQDKLKNASNDDKVVIIINKWDNKHKIFFGEIIRVLGKNGEYHAEMHGILSQYDFSYKFSDKVKNYVDNLDLEIKKNDIKNRMDIRNVLTFTIDPFDAKDFDDALSFQVLKNGNYEIGIHIADVSHYVELDSILDQEAYDRGTSIYLVDKVISMLPEILSNDVCSLNSNEDKLTFSVIFQLNENAQIEKQWFGKTIINSDKRFSYEEVQFLIEQRNTFVDVIPNEISLTGKYYKVDSKIRNAILKIDELAKIIRKNRIDLGALVFDKLETKFNLDKNLNPVSIFFKESNDAHKLIEEFMLLANRKVAEFIGKKKKDFIYRVHDRPDIEKLKDLKNLVSKFGYNIDIKSKSDISKSLNKLLLDVSNKPESNMIETLVIRSMSKAEYTTENIGHYGLSFDFYTHFTSPIRRYSDIITHRLLNHYLKDEKISLFEENEKKCKYLSEREMLALKVERESIKYMQVKYMKNFVGKIFKGLISGVTNWGIYVELIENKCEGMIKIKNIEDDIYFFNEKEYSLIGTNYKKRYRLGDEITIQVRNADLKRKYLDFRLAEY